MKEIIQNLLHVTVKEKETPALEQLPLFLKSGYDIRFFSIGDLDVLFIRPREPITITALNKQWKRFELLTGFPCAVYGNEYTRYKRERMIELGIPFCFGKDNLYLPFLGLVLGRKKTVCLPEINKFSPMTQKMILTALYEKWELTSTREIGDKLGVSRATAARCLTELQALDLPLIDIGKKTKYYQYGGSIKDLYKMCEPYFDNPIVKRYSLAEIPGGLSCYGGLTAIAGYSILGDNDYPTFAVTREEFRKLDARGYEIQPSTEKPVCMLHILRYKIEINGAIDPISAILCVPEVEKEDPRMAGAVEAILEEVFDGKGVGSVQT